MSLMSYVQLCALVNENIITDVPHEHINASSIDVTLGDEIIIEVAPNYAETSGVVSPEERTNFTQKRIKLDQPYYMAPGEFILAHTQEKFNLPNNISAEFRLKSSGARSGLNNLFACHCDPGWHGSTLTLELHNVLKHHAIKLTPGMRIGQMLFHYHIVPVPDDRSYAARGRYNKDESVSEVKQ